jgi:hypothetical protein
MSKMETRLSVGELLENSQQLFDSGHFRGSVMEAMTALEERVNEVVFEHLVKHKGLPSALVEWIRSKTKYSFDEKLHPVGEFALGKPINKSEQLWQRYKYARGIRNKVSHTAEKIEKSDAASVMQTVKEWLHYLEGAQDHGALFESSDKLKEFFKWYALLLSRFDYRGSEQNISLGRLAIMAVKNGSLPSEVANQIQEIAAIRNRLAHAQIVDDLAIGEAIQNLMKIVQPLKGTEIIIEN